MPRRPQVTALLATAKERMAAKVPDLKKRCIPGRKVIVEPVFGQIEARGFRRFLLRGLDNIRGEWRLVCVTHNLLKIWRYACCAAHCVTKRWYPMYAMPLFRRHITCEPTVSHCNRGRDNRCVHLYTQTVGLAWIKGLYALILGQALVPAARVMLAAGSAGGYCSSSMLLRITSTMPLHEVLSHSCFSRLWKSVSHCIPDTSFTAESPGQRVRPRTTDEAARGVAHQATPH